MIMKRPLSREIAGEQQSPLDAIPQGEREIAVKPLVLRHDADAAVADASWQTRRARLPERE